MGILHPAPNHTDVFRHCAMSWPGTRSKLLGVNNKKPICFPSCACHHIVMQARERNYYVDRLRKRQKYTQTLRQLALCCFMIRHIGDTVRFWVSASIRVRIRVIIRLILNVYGQLSKFWGLHGRRIVSSMNCYERQLEGCVVDSCNQQLPHVCYYADVGMTGCKLNTLLAFLQL